MSIILKPGIPEWYEFFELIIFGPDGFDIGVGNPIIPQEIINEGLARRKPKATKILRSMKNVDIKGTFKFFKQWGGYYDAQIILSTYKYLKYFDHEPRIEVYQDGTEYCASIIPGGYHVISVNPNNPGNAFLAELPSNFTNSTIMTIDEIDAAGLQMLYQDTLPTEYPVYDVDNLVQASDEFAKAAEICMIKFVEGWNIEHSTRKTHFLNGMLKPRWEADPNFLNANVLNQKSSTLYPIPNSTELRGIRAGNKVKVVAANEEIEIVVSRVQGDQLNGEVSIHPDETEFHNLRYGTEVDFVKDNIFEIIDEIPNSNDDILH
jgi:hypothetical protein